MSPQRLIALVDCNNFYVSCERVFRPDLIGKPVAVLSNNDGCVVARSAEVKKLGIKMGVPLFQIQQLVNQHQIKLFSSNYTLYADMSARVMATLEEFAPNLEVYSIDEGFLDLTGVYPCGKDPIAYGQLIRKTVVRTTGIPVCVGLGPTKTLAKLANFAAKKWPRTGGVLDLSDPVRREKLMRIVPVGEVWGIGPRTAAKLNQLGIHTVWDLASQSSKRIQAQFNVVVARTVMELNGTPCLQLEAIAPDKQQIVCSRSFSRRLTEYAELSQAMAEFCTSAPRFFAKAEMGSVRFQQRKMTWRLLPSAAPIRPASVPLRHIIVYSMRLRSTPTNGFTPCRDALYFASACAIRADSGKTPGATAIGD
ncbi:Y-family DNA polymerase [Methylotuvimicrobium sp. KM2]|uniref:Y-family DNA polymerase n=1 Tax=Methylotuvimicrobium sp. KM2 TaxID=3133976 RepID=UPI003100EC5E